MRRTFLVLTVLFQWAIYHAQSTNLFEATKQLEIFTEFYQNIYLNYGYKTNPSTLMNNAIKGLLQDLDPYTQYYDEASVLNAKLYQTQRASSLGMQILYQKDYLLVTEITKGSSVDKSDLKVGDKIIAVNDIPIEQIAPNDDEILAGPIGSKVSLDFTRNNKRLKTIFTREKFSYKAVPFYKMIENKIGYITLNSFSRTAFQEVKYALLDLKNQGAEELILDLRSNPGGLLSEAIKIVGLFIPKNTVIVTVDSYVEKYKESISTVSNPVDLNIPLAILINEKSASASEIVAGALQDYDRAVLIGTTSFGKGLVQKPMQLPFDTQMKITIARYLLPSGRSIQIENYNDSENIQTESQNSKYATQNGRKVIAGKGVTPDITLKPTKNIWLLRELLNRNYIFEFAIEVIQNQNFKSVDDIGLSQIDFITFKKFINQKPQTNSNSKNLLKTALKEMIKEKQSVQAQNQLKNLIESMDEISSDALDELEDKILSMISEEIAKALFYNEGLYQYREKNSEELTKALSVLKDKALYQKILNF